MNINDNHLLKLTYLELLLFSHYQIAGKYINRLFPPESEYSQAYFSATSNPISNWESEETRLGYSLGLIMLSHNFVPIFIEARNNCSCMYEFMSAEKTLVNYGLLDGYIFEEAWRISIEQSS